jgi:hypothetical protein
VWCVDGFFPRWGDDFGDLPPILERTHPFSCLHLGARVEMPYHSLNMRRAQLVILTPTEYLASKCEERGMFSFRTQLSNSNPSKFLNLFRNIDVQYGVSMSKLSFFSSSPCPNALMI